MSPRDGDRRPKSKRSTRPKRSKGPAGPQDPQRARGSKRVFGRSRSKGEDSPGGGTPGAGSGADGGRRVVVGRRFVLEALGGGTVDQCWIESGILEKVPDLAEAAERAGVPLTEATRDELDRRARGVRHQGVVAMGPPFSHRSLESLLELDAPLLVALDEITDPQNFGAIIRSALVFGADGILVPRHRSATLSPAVVRASAGASERAAIAEVPNLQKALVMIRDQGLEVVGLDAGGDITVAELGPAPRGRVIVVGSEGKGLRRLVRERCDRIASIPQSGGFDSLNASVAAGIALYEASRTRS